jgi:hypothetical protein
MIAYVVEFIIIKNRRRGPWHTPQCLFASILHTPDRDFAIELAIMLLKQNMARVHVECQVSLIILSCHSISIACNHR